MNRWVVLILFATLGLKFISGGIMMSGAHGMDMDSCEGVACGVTADQCLEHCLAVGQIDTVLPAATQSVFFLVVGALVIGLAVVVETKRVRARTTGLAPPGLVFVRNTILRE